MQIPADLKVTCRTQFEWLVNYKQMLSSQEKKHYSPPHECNGLHWRLLLFPHGNQGSDYLSVFLECTNNDNSIAEGDKNWHQCAMFQVVLVQESTAVHSDSINGDQVAKHRFDKTEVDWGFNRFFPVKDIAHDQFVLKCEVALIEDETGTLWHSFNNWDSRQMTGHVGLRNQGATCYMNSLLQSLYFTNSFRKALFKIPTSRVEGQSSKIPLALQRVFYHLQHSQDAVDTRELTKSFGWDSLEAFMQHDVQEFNRVLQDVLEKQMKGTEAEGAIEKLFVGKMASYIKCLHVEYQSQREETFYDIQLNVKGQKTLADSFQDYIQTEILSGDNKYMSDTFGLQEAKKGVIFTKFPPVLHLQLKRFEYDFVKDAMVKINDRFEFPSQIDLSPYLDPQCKAAKEPQTYTLYGVLVHSGDVSGGHYMAYLKPQKDSKWYKFDDDRVTQVHISDVFEDNFGGDPSQQRLDSKEVLPPPVPIRTRALMLKRFTNAYMLVYIRDVDVDEILAPVTADDVPAHLAQTLEKEESERQKQAKELSEQHLYVNVRLYMDADFRQSNYQGFDLFDPMDTDVGTVHRVRKDQKWSEFVTFVAQQLQMKKEQIRLWTFHSRSNLTIRHDAPLSDSLVEQDDFTVERVVYSQNHRHGQDFRLYVECAMHQVQDPATGKVVYFSPFNDKDPMVALFIRFFDPSNGGSLEYVGMLKVKCTLKAQDLIPMLNELKQLPPGTALKIYEEIKPGMVELLKMNRTMVQLELGDGDILTFQKELPKESIKSDYSIAPAYYDFLYNRITVPFKPFPGSSIQKEFEITLSRKSTYDQLASKVAHELGIVDPLSIRFHLNPTGGDKPKIVIRRVQNTTIQEILTSLVYSASSMPLCIWYEPLNMSVTEMEMQKQWQVILLDQHYREKEAVVLLAHKNNGTIGDLIAALKSKMPNVTVLRVLEVSNSRRLTTLAMDQHLNIINENMSQICVETEQYNDSDVKLLNLPHKMVTVFHFFKDYIRQAWGIPCKIMVRPGTTVAELRVKIKSRLAIPEKELSKIKLFLITPTSAKGLEDDSMIIGDIVTEKDYIGLDHADKSLRRAGGAEHSVKIGG